MTGSGARGVSHNCDFLSDSIATVNPSARVRCVLDGPDLAPYWVRSPQCWDEVRRREGGRGPTQPMLVSLGVRTLSVAALVVVGNGVDSWVALRVSYH